MTNEELKKLMWCGTPQLEEEEAQQRLEEALSKLPPAAQEEMRKAIATVQRAEGAVADGTYPDLLTALRAMGLDANPVQRH